MPLELPSTDPTATQQIPAQGRDSRMLGANPHPRTAAAMRSPENGSVGNVTPNEFDLAEWPCRAQAFVLGSW
jgi:hypothetical protein